MLLATWLGSTGPRCGFLGGEGLSPGAGLVQEEGGEIALPAFG